MKYKADIKKICMTGCIVVLIFFMFMIGIRSFRKVVSEKQSGVDNVFVKINWEEYYPFLEDGQKDNIKKKLPESQLFERYYIDVVNFLKEKLNRYSTEKLFGYSRIVEFARKYDGLIGWNLVSYSEYNGAQEMSDGYWITFSEKLETKENAESVIKLDRYCKKQDADFLYVQAPNKISKYNDTDISGIVDFSNQNTDELLDALFHAGVAVYDLHKEIYEEGLNHHKLFYKTDHHWLPTTGLWASGKILKYCKEHYNYHIDMSLISMDNFEIIEYPKWFLGSYGKKVTLERTEPEDFSLIYPKYSTNFHYKLPSKSIDKKGDFSIMYDMDQVEEKGYYDRNPYAAYNYGDWPLVQIKNLSNVENKKILVVKDSFGNCVTPFLALEVKQVDVIDLRSFDGSLETYINMSKPDTVILLYNPGVEGKIDWDSHTSLFDFR